MKESYLNDEFFSRLETLSLELRADLAGFFGGKHLVRTYGQTVEFADYREYMLGDDIRRIDWNLYSRFEKFFLKLFTDERQMHTQIFIDCSASMGKDNPKKAAYTIGVAAALGYLSVHNMDKVSYHLIKGEKAENPFGTIVGKRAFFNAISTLEELEFDEESDLQKAVLNTKTGSNDGLTVIISDFFTDFDWKKAVDYLCYKKRQVLLVQIATPEELDPTYSGRVHLIDSECPDLGNDKIHFRENIDRSWQKAYQDALTFFKADMKDFCSKRNVDVIHVSTDMAIEKVLFSELLKAGIMA